MNNISLDFQQAKIKHLQFKSNLRSILYGVLTIEEKPVLSHHECAVGKWIYGHALNIYRNIPEILQLEKVHEEIHTKARQLVELYKEGKVSEAKTVLSEIEAIADRLVNLLEKVEEKIKENSSLELSSYQNLDHYKKELNHLAETNENLDKIIKQQSLELSHERHNLKELFMQFPAMITVIKGKEQIIEMCNEPALNFIGKSDVVGKTVKEVLPETESQGFLQIIDSVYTNGNHITQKETPLVLIDENNNQKRMFIDLNFIPLKNYTGQTEGVISFSYDVTVLVESRKRVEESMLLLKHANEDLEIKVTFRNKQLEKENLELIKRLQKFESK